MNLVNLLLTLQVALLCLAVCIARPSSLPDDSSRGRSRSRKMRLLQRVLRQLTHSEVLTLLRTKKSRNRNNPTYNSYFSVEPSQPQVTIPEIDCPKAMDGSQLFSCPTPDEFGVYQCIDDHDLCDHKVHCPNGEDEDRTVCMYHRVTMNNFKVLMEAIFGLTKAL